jgi:hypothetical protein
MTFNRLFSYEPSHWGLRGNPFLWKELKDHLKGINVPNRDSEIYEILSYTFKNLTGHSIESRDDLFIQRFSHGGMSSGHIAPEFWRTTAFQFLCESRQKKYK